MADQDSTQTPSHPDPEFIRSLIVDYIGRIDYGTAQQPRQCERVFLLVLALTGRDLSEVKGVDTPDILDACSIPYSIDTTADQDTDDCVVLPEEWLKSHGFVSTGGLRGNAINNLWRGP